MSPQPVQQNKGNYEVQPNTTPYSTLDDHHARVNRTKNVCLKSTTLNHVRKGKVYGRLAEPPFSYVVPRSIDQSRRRGDMSTVFRSASAWCARPGMYNLAVLRQPQEVGDLQRTNFTVCGFLSRGLPSTVEGVSRNMK